MIAVGSPTSAAWNPVAADPTRVATSAVPSSNACARPSASAIPTHRNAGSPARTGAITTTLSSTESSRHGPVPTHRPAMLSAAIAAGAITAPALTISRMSAMSRVVTSRSVREFTTSTSHPARYCAHTPGAPSVAPTAGSAMRINEAATAAASHAVPSWNTAPGRSRNSVRLASSCTHSSASPATNRPGPTRRTSGSNTASSSASASALSVQSCGSNSEIRVWAMVSTRGILVAVASGAL